MKKIFRCRTALLGIAVILTVCGCSAGSPDEAEAAISSEQAENEHPIAQDMPVWISEETSMKEEHISAEPKGSEKGSPIRNMPVVIFDKEQSGEGGLVSVTVIDPDGGDPFERELSEIAED